ncbi:MAG: protein kinase, partial [Chloroflexi bacterium]|nr:protein kinase [Chloroflexota bacterium]
MKPEQQCPRCGQTLPPDAPAGHCPKCLVQLALEAAAAPTVVPADEAATPPAGAQPLSSAGSRVKYFGDYELIEEIARGGMGVVWRARQTSLNRVVALKMILAGRFAGEADVRRFHTEAEAAANLQHPNIVAIHEIGQHEGQHYFSMDYVEGKSLAELVMDGPLPAAQAAALVKNIAEAVHYAHQRGTLHRDLKPSNVLIDAEGQPRITDFGLAKRFGVPPLGGSDARIPAKAGTPGELTQTGAVLGTPAYMPPEQAAGRNEQVGPASDVYSIGAMLYHLLTGRAPFVGETPAATLRQAMEDEPVAPSKLNPQTPPDLETICLKCLEKRPDRRYHSARELAEELGRFLNHEPILARPASAWRKGWSWSQRHPWALVG